LNRLGRIHFLGLVSLSVLCFFLALGGAVGVYVSSAASSPSVEGRLSAVEADAAGIRLDTEHRMTRLETWQAETQWEIHGTLAGVGGLILERAFSGRRRRRRGQSEEE
jgi:hypothetical protein